MHAFRLEFRGDAISGGGEDRDGPFAMQGEVDGDRVYLMKTYPWLVVRYDGLWNGAFVAGRSTIGPLGHGEFGTFEIWPEDEETTMEKGETREFATA